MAASLVTDDVLRRFLERIGQDLESRPVELEADAHRGHLSAALERCARGTLYELLEIDPDADQEEIHAAYRRIARLVHPDHADRLGLEDRVGVAELLFERATQAYLVLSDPHRRRSYDRDAVIEERPPAERRREERARIAADFLERARRLVERDDYHYALELLQQAVRADPDSAEAWALMGRCRARNPQWLHMAGDSLRTALRLRPDSTEYRLALAEVEEARGRTGDAERLFRRVLERAPDHAAAREGLERVAGDVA